VISVQVLAETVAASPTSPMNLHPVLHGPVINKQAADEQGISSAMQPNNAAACSSDSSQLEPPVHGVELGGRPGKQGKGDAASNAALVDDAMTLNAAPDGQSGTDGPTTKKKCNAQNTLLGMLYLSEIPVG